MALKRHARHDLCTHLRCLFSPLILCDQQASGAEGFLQGWKCSVDLTVKRMVHSGLHPPELQEAAAIGTTRDCDWPLSTEEQVLLKGVLLTVLYS